MIDRSQSALAKTRHRRWMRTVILVHVLVACSATTELAFCQPPNAPPETSNNALPGDDLPDENLSGEVQSLMRGFQGKGALADDSRPVAPADVATTFTTLDDLEIELVAHEPNVEQPLFMTWDSRGRLWVVEYRQYQYPAGLKVVRYDQYLRAVFDKTPLPPPDGTRGLDRIRVFEDTDRDGDFDVSKIVLDGLNIATSVQVGRDGLWVLNPPYLLFYPDRDQDDQPDADPEVHLTGFGIQDTHSVANNLTWGVDGWLYGVNGSTTGGRVTVERGDNRGAATVFEGQCVWRYHPRRNEFELFAEGGGNTFSLEIDSKGQVFSGTNVGNTRGLHYHQGAYYQKNWGKHGPLTNPYAYGYFGHMPHEGDPRRFAQAFVVYEGGRLPDQYSRQVIAANSLHNLVWRSELKPKGGSFKTIDRSNLLESSDRWFRPVHCAVGPDGWVYLADWYDTRLSHLSPVDNWHKESGRLYRIRSASEGSTEKSVDHETVPDLSRATADQLVDLFKHRNKWVRQRAVLELQWREDPSIFADLANLVDKDASLEAFWVLYESGKIDSSQLERWLRHPSADIRYWAVRYLGDETDRRTQISFRVLVSETSRAENSISVRIQYAATAKRVDPSVATAIILGLLTHQSDETDDHQPLMLWWAIESHADHKGFLEDLYSRGSAWTSPIWTRAILPRLMRRFASKDQIDRAVQLFRLASDHPDFETHHRNAMLSGLHQGIVAGPHRALPSDIAAVMSDYLRGLGTTGLSMAIRQGDGQSIAQSNKLIVDAKQPLVVRTELVRSLSVAAARSSISPLLRLATDRNTPTPLRRVAIESLAAFDDPKIADRLIAAFTSSISTGNGLRETACRTLASRKTWAEKLVQEINQWRLKSEDVPSDAIWKMRMHNSQELSKALDQAFGTEPVPSNQQKQLMIKRLAAVVRQTPGDPDAGKSIFQQKCGNCHRLFGSGKSVGPALDGYERKNPKFWLVGVVDPSLEIREGYQTYKALTGDGRVLLGRLLESNNQTVVLQTIDDNQHTLLRSELERFEAVKTSLMPEGLLDKLTEQEWADLYAYLSQDFSR